MNILYMTLNYAIDEEGLYGDLISGLLKKGHKIALIRPEKSTKLFKVKENFEILDVKTGNPFEKNKFKKGMNQLLLNYYFKRAIKKWLNNRKFDLILYATPPITLCGTIIYCKDKYNAKTFLMLKDIFPQNAVDLKLIRKDGIIYKYFRKQEREYYKISDFIGCMSKGNVEFIKRYNPDILSSKLSIFPNSIDITNLKETIFNKEKTVFIFGGNLGIPQNIEGLLNIIKKMENYKKAEFVIVGQGTEKEKIEKFLENKVVSNLKFLEFLPQDQYENLLQTADIGLISLDPRFTIPNIPSKFQTYLKLKKPVLAITDTSTDLREMIVDNNCGWWCDARNEEMITKTIREICENKEEQLKKGGNGFEYLKREFDIKNNIKIIEEFMKNMT